jgi:hypothetical protein
MPRKTVLSGIALTLYSATCAHAATEKLPTDCTGTTTPGIAINQPTTILSTSNNSSATGLSISATGGDNISNHTDNRRGGDRNYHSTATNINQRAMRPSEKNVPTEVREEQLALQCGSNFISQSAKSDDSGDKKKQADVSEKIKDILEGLAKLISSLAWPALAFYAVRKFRKEIGERIGNIKDLEGLGVKVNFDKVFRPQQTGAPSAEADAPASDADATTTAQSSTIATVARTPGSLAAELEGLVFRALQEEFGVLAKQRVTAGKNDRFDGVFIIEDHVVIVEVKYVKDANSFLNANSPFNARLKQSIDRLLKAVEKYDWDRPRILLVFVCETLDGIPQRGAQLASEFSTATLPVTARYFTRAELEARFNITSSN